MSFDHDARSCSHRMDEAVDYFFPTKALSQHSPNANFLSRLIARLSAGKAGRPPLYSI